MLTCTAHVPPFLHHTVSASSSSKSKIHATLTLQLTFQVLDLNSQLNQATSNIRASSQLQHPSSRRTTKGSKRWLSKRTTLACFKAACNIYYCIELSNTAIPGAVPSLLLGPCTLGKFYYTKRKYLDTVTRVFALASRANYSS